MDLDGAAQWRKTEVIEVERAKKMCVGGDPWIGVALAQEVEAELCLRELLVPQEPTGSCGPRRQGWR